MTNRKIIVSGTGRAGTTFIMKIFSFLGLDTGFNPKRFEKHVDPVANAGMELYIGFIKGYRVPYILKSPAFIEHIHKVLEKTKIDYMIIPLRDFEDSAQSRFRLKDNVTNCGALWNATDVESQKMFYHKILSDYLLAMVQYDIPTIFIDFKRMIVDEKYLFEKLKPIMDQHNKPFDDFRKAYWMSSVSSSPNVFV
jgi:hypothetical protein